MIELFLPIFFLIAALVFIHALFGFEIITRGIIFTDLAIGQAAAFGVALSLLVFDGHYRYILSLFMALSSALFIAYVSKKSHKEASIGLIYALGLSSVFLLLSQSAKGMEIFLELTASDILFSSLEDILGSILLYTLIALLFYILVIKQKIPKIKELSFFILFALTVTNSVHVTGVLVVFILLIAPAYMALVLKKRHLIANILGISISFSALILSSIFDLPAGHTIITLMSLSALTIMLIQNKRGNV